MNAAPPQASAGGAGRRDQGSGRGARRSLDEAVDLLRRGSVREWNRWRRSSPPERLRLELDLADLDLSRIDLSGLTLHGAHLERVALRAANLFHARILGSRLRGCCFDRADLSEIRIVRTRLDACRFRRAGRGARPLRAPRVRKRSVCDGPVERRPRESASSTRSTRRQISS